MTHAIALSDIAGVTTPSDVKDAVIQDVSNATLLQESASNVKITTIFTTNVVSQSVTQPVASVANLTDSIVVPVTQATIYMGPLVIPLVHPHFSQIQRLILAHHVYLHVKLVPLFQIA